MSLLFHAFIYFLFFLLAFLPVGQLLSPRIAPALSARMQILLGFGCSAIIYPLFLTILLAVGLPNPAIAMILRVFIVAALFIWCRSSQAKHFFSKEMLTLLALTFCYLALTLAVSAFPDLNYLDVSPRLTMDLSSLPIDNMIPYNFARYVLNRIDPNSINVIDVWKASDRGPIAALSFAGIALALGLSDPGPWSSGAPGVFFIYQAFITFLNLFSLFAVWTLAREFATPRAAALSLLTLLTGSFYFVNVLFSWPKFLMAYFVLTAIALQVLRASPVLTGTFAAAASLSHDSAAFCVAGIGLLILCSCYQLKGNLRARAMPLIHFVLGYALLTSPWSLYKKLYSPPSPRLIYFHLFCDTRESLNSTSFSEALQYYLAHNGINDILYTKIYNLFFPFDISAPFKFLDLPLSTYFVELFNNIPGETFQRYIWGVSPFIFLVLLSIFGKRRKAEVAKQLLPFIWVTFGALFFVALLSGCLGNSASHVWAAPAILSTALCVGWVLADSGWLLSTLAACGIGLNLVATTIYIHYHSLIRPVLHGSPEYFLLQGALLLLSLLLILRLEKSQS